MKPALIVLAIALLGLWYSAGMPTPGDLLRAVGV